MTRPWNRPLEQFGRPCPTDALNQDSLWRAVVTTIATCVVLGSTSSCAPAQYVYKMYPGPTRSENELAIVSLNDAARATIGDRNVSHADYSRAQLLPGTYPVNWACVHGASVLVERSGFISATASADVELRGGHVYSLHCARTYGRGYQTYQWMVDMGRPRMG